MVQSQSMNFSRRKNLDNERIKESGGCDPFIANRLHVSIICNIRSEIRRNSNSSVTPIFSHKRSESNAIPA